MNMPFVAILMGSDSDLPVMRNTLEILEKFGIPFEVRITSAHRTPKETHAYVTDADQRGCAVFIAAAGLAAHLAGAVSAQTIKPVIGVPLDAGGLGGMDSLLSTVQMPGGIPVASVAIGKPGAKNAAYLAAQIIAINDREVALRLKGEREANARAIIEKSAVIQQQFNKD